MIIKPADMDFSEKNIIMILSGTPGTGKSTLALSAPNVLLIDADNGMCRVNIEHRHDASLCKTFEEIRADVKAARGHYKTIAIDTGGALVDMIKQHVIDHPDEYAGGAQKSGGISQKGFGYIKQIFLEFSAELRRDFNVVYVFHEQRTKEDETIIYELVCEGSAKTIVYQPADIAAHLFIQNGRRMLGFTPTEQYFAKSAYGIKGLIEVPELKPGEPNEFLTRLFQLIREELAADAARCGSETKKYEAAIETGKGMVLCVNNPEDVIPCLEAIKTIEHALTSEKEIANILKARMKEIGIQYDKKAKAYVRAEQ